MKKLLALLPLIALAGCGGGPDLTQRCESALKARWDLPEYWFRDGTQGFVTGEDSEGKKVVWQFAYQDPQDGYKRMRGICFWNEATDEINVNMQPLGVFVKDLRVFL